MKAPVGNFIISISGYQLPKIVKPKIVPDIKKTDGLKIVYLCQPYKQEYQDISGKVDYITDVSAVEYFLQNVSDYLPDKAEVRLRKHPLEANDKYRNVIQSFNNSVKVTVSKNQSLAEANLKPMFLNQL